MPLKQPEMILIDLDGTLVDSVPDLAYCVDELMTRLGRLVWGEAKVRMWVGNGVERLVKRALTGEMHGEPDPVLFTHALAIFNELYQTNNAVLSCLFPGVKEGLVRLQAEGYTLGCVTNKAGRFTEPLLRDLGIREHFGIVVSGDTTPQKKPHPAPLLHAADFFKVSPDRAVMLGDSRHDVEAARAAGFAAICVSYGYNHGEDIRKSHPDAVIDSLTEIPELFSKAV